MGDLIKIRDKGIKIGADACKLDKDKRYEEAFNAYIESIELLKHVIKCKLSFHYIDESNEYVRTTVISKAGEYLNRAFAIKEYLKTKKTMVPAQPTGSIPDKKGTGEDKPKDGEENKDANADLKKALSSAVVTEKPNVKWEDVAGLERAKSLLQEAVTLPIKFPQLYVGKIKPWKGILLYGPPGTGKSFLAKACATETQGTFFSVSSSDLITKWLGESERLVRSLFEMARESRPAVIFIDEVDSLCGTRKEGENDSSRRVKTEFLVQMEGVGKGADGVLVLGATNVPWELDSAIRRRFEKRIYIPLPEKEARKKMFKLHIGDTPNLLTDDEYGILAEHTEGYSGSDISVVVKDALMQPIRKCQAAARFKITEDGYYIPTSPSDPQGQDE